MEVPRTRGFLGPTFDLEKFVRQLLVDALFYDSEYDALGNVSLIDTEDDRERFLASYDTERDVFHIEEAVEWEELDADEDKEGDYALAVDAKEHGTFDTPEEAADTLLQLARDHNLAPSFTVIF